MIRIGSLWKYLGENYMTSGVLDRIAEEKPIFTVIRDRKNERDSDAMIVKIGRRKVGYINADDTRFLEPMMERNKTHITFSHVVWPMEEGSSAIVKCKADVDMEKVAPVVREVIWDEIMLSAPCLRYNGFTDELELAINILTDHIEGTAQDGDMTPDECVDEISRTCCFDMSCETTELLNDLCMRLELAGDDESIRLLERIEAASTHRRSRRNHLALAEWIEDLMEGEESDYQWNRYKIERRRELKVSSISEEQIREDLERYEQELLALPYGLCELIDEPEKLLGCAFYKKITREKQDDLIAELVLRNTMKEYLYKAEEVEDVEETVEDVDVVEEAVETVDPIAMELKDCFFGIVHKAEKFLMEIRGKKQHEITRTVNDWLSRREISDCSCHRQLWSILHAHKIYTRTESNWNSQVGR